MALVDRGDSRAVTYLGSCMLTTSATGVGAVQKPLRDLYFSYRQSGGAPDPARQRYLTMSSRGLTMSWKEASKPSPTEVFYNMPNILFWDAVQFVVVRGTKKLCGAFEPLDNDHSRNKDNLFVVLEKKYHFLQQMRHPSLFVCVLRRTTGVKAMDVHVFVCSSDEEALGLVHGLNTIQDSYNENQVNETGAFSYRPFSTAGESGSGVSGAPVSRPVPGLGQPPTGPGPANIQHLAAQNAVAAAAAARDSQAYPRQLVDQSGHKSQDSNSSLASSVINLTQNDFQPIARGSAERGPLRNRKSGLPEPDVSRIEEEEDVWNNDENVYQYIRHIDESSSPAAAQSRFTPDSRGFAPPNSRGAPVVTSPFDRNRNRIPSGDNDRGDFGRNQPREYQSMTRSIELDQDTLTATQLRPSNIIARFEERSKATAAVRPQSIVPPKVAPKTAPKPVPSPVDRSPGNLGQGYSFLSGSGSPLPDQDDRRYHDNAPSPYPRARSPGYDRELPDDSSLPRQHLIPSAFYANQDDRNVRGYNEYDREQPPRIPDRSRPVAADAWVPPRDQYKPPPRYNNQPPPEQPLIRQHQPPPFDRPRSFGDRNTSDAAPPRPVAKVTPHKVSGVGVGVRVLPPNPVVPRSPGERPTGRVSPLDHQSKSNMPEEYHGQTPPRGAKSQYYGEQHFQAGSSGSHERRDYEANWKIKSHEKEENKKDGKKGEETDKNMSEKLLLSKKKDAEIASVMQNLRFDYDTSTVTPGVPAGNNFEKSLGYFP